MSTREPVVATVEVTADDAGRADKAIANHYPDAGRKQLAALFDAGAVRLAGKRAHKGDRVMAGDVLELSRLPVGGDALRPLADPDAAGKLVVLLERPELVVVGKPAGMPSQPLRAGELGTAANGLAARWPECAAFPAEPAYDVRDGGLVHRLDIGTSGALIAARDPATYRTLRDAFAAGLVEKQYLAITDGRPVARECDAPLAQRGRRVVVDQTDGLEAYTAFEVERATATHALVRCTAQTGRMHQVRAHLATVGAPIVGDTLYGGTPLPDHAGFFLHAARVTFLAGTERIAIDAPLPAAFAAVVAQLGL
jgi:23S rRNA pseudouridine1911/1915/1917 synthase